MTDEPYFDYGFDSHWHDHMSPHGEPHSGEDLWDMRCHPDCDDQLAVFSSVGRGLKGDGYKVRVIEGDSGETFLEGLRQDSTTGEYSRDWVSSNIDGGKLTYKYNLHPFTSPKTFTITFAYHKTGDEEDDWTWTTPSIPYIWGDEDINVPSIDAFDGLQEQIDALAAADDSNYATLNGLIQPLIQSNADLQARVTSLEGELTALKNTVYDILDHVYGSYNTHSGSSDWLHFTGGDVYVGSGTVEAQGRTLSAGNVYWNFLVSNQLSSTQNIETYLPVGNLNVYGGYHPSGTSPVTSNGVLRTHPEASQGDVWVRDDAQPGGTHGSLTGAWEHNGSAWVKVADL